MIFVTVGTHNMDFDRLLRALDGYLEKGEIVQTCRAQRGYSNYEPRHYSCRRFFPPEEFLKLLRSAEVVVTHAGGGVVTACLREGKKMVVVPRLKKFGEHTNNHQLEIARQLAEEGLAEVVYRMDDFPRALKIARDKPVPAPPRRGTPRIARIIGDFLTNLAALKSRGKS